VLSGEVSVLKASGSAVLTRRMARGCCWAEGEREEGMGRRVVLG
jgi:hypothetical protein